MSIIFGICQPEGPAVQEKQLAALARATERYAPEGTIFHTSGGIGMGFQPYRTHDRSNLESQPAVDRQGNTLTFDGRIDNHEELCELLEIKDLACSDSQIVLAAFERWRDGCFSCLVGDWALTLWAHSERSLYLARDHAGTRTLYVCQKDGEILWSTCLETFLEGGRSYDPDQVYAACYLVGLPARDRTPYQGIAAVTPAHYIVFRGNGQVRRKHWQCFGKNQISYKVDAEYEEHFLALFRQSVERRTGPGAPLLAELSGGMDSSSIVCMSDHIRTERGAVVGQLIDTVSYYDDCDPHWNERPFFNCVEGKRKKQGIHLPLPLLSEELAPCPIRCLVPGKERTAFENEVRFEESIRSKGYRSILSGIGGDELLGGVPTPLPELADHLASAEWRKFLKRTMAWCLVDRTPFAHMAWAATQYLLDQRSAPEIRKDELPPWSTRKLHHLLHASAHDAEEEGRLSGIEPSRVGNGRAWRILLETLPHLAPRLLARYEYRYPFLDRDLVDYIFRIPRERLLQPGRRRSMMRSALQGIVPAEVLERPRKAFRSRALVPLLKSSTRIASLLEHSHAAAAGLIDSTDLVPSVVRALTDGDGCWIQAVLRLVLFELWQESFNEHAPRTETALNAQTFVV